MTDYLSLLLEEQLEREEPSQEGDWDTRSQWYVRQTEESDKLRMPDGTPYEQQDAAEREPDEAAGYTDAGMWSKPEYMQERTDRGYWFSEYGASESGRQDSTGQQSAVPSSEQPEDSGTETLAQTVGNRMLQSLRQRTVLTDVPSTGIYYQGGFWNTGVTSHREEEQTEDLRHRIEKWAAAGPSVRNWIAGTAIPSTGTYEQDGFWSTGVTSRREGEQAENLQQRTEEWAAAGPSVRNWIAGTVSLSQAGVRTPSERNQMEVPLRNEGAGWINRNVQASLQPLMEKRAEHSVVTVERTADRLSAERLEAERLDRLFRRDARRYDGGYQLL